MSPLEYEEHLLRAHLVAQMLVDMPLAEMLSAIDHADSVGVMFSPTLWMEKHRAMDQDREIVQALRTAQAAIAESRRRAGVR